MIGMQTVAAMRSGILKQRNALNFNRLFSAHSSSIGRNDSKKQGGTGKVSFNRFSVFVKSGGENYILGKVNANIQESDVLAVVEGGDGSFSWLNTQPPYSCSIASPKKESKMKGLKTFIAYQLTPSVSRYSILWVVETWESNVPEFSSKYTQFVL